MKVSCILALLVTGLALAAPTPTDKGAPTEPQPYGPDKSVSKQPWKRHTPTEPEPYGPTQSVTRQPWKRHVDAEVEVEERGEDNLPKPYPSGAWAPHTRNVEDALPEPEHFEVLTA